MLQVFSAGVAGISRMLQVLTAGTAFKCGWVSWCLLNILLAKIVVTEDTAGKKLSLTEVTAG